MENQLINHNLFAEKKCIVDEKFYRIQENINNRNIDTDLVIQEEQNISNAISFLNQPSDTKNNLTQEASSINSNATCVDNYKEDGEKLKQEVDLKSYVLKEYVKLANETKDTRIEEIVSFVDMDVSCDNILDSELQISTTENKLKHVQNENNISKNNIITAVKSYVKNNVCELYKFTSLLAKLTEQLDENQESIKNYY